MNILFAAVHESAVGLSGGSQGGEFTSAFGGAAEVHGRTASAAFDANDPKPTYPVQNFCSANDHLRPISLVAKSCFDGLS